MRGHVPRVGGIALGTVPLGSVNRLAGAPRQAADCLRAALRIYEDQHAAPLVEQARATLASLAAQLGAKSA